MELLVKGTEIPPPVHTAVFMWITLDGMSWNHLPNAGGWYDQDPDFCDKMNYIFGMKAKADAQKQREEERSRNTKGKPRVPGGRGR